jgi:cell division protein FtsW (lipid II flippase)
LLTTERYKLHIQVLLWWSMGVFCFSLCTSLKDKQWKLFLYVHVFYLLLTFIIAI